MTKDPYVEDSGPRETGAQGFTFPLSTRVEGLNARGKEFAEDTVLTYISHEGSSFYLKNPVQIGMRLKLIIDLPEKLSREKSLKMVIKGRVTLVEADRDRLIRQNVTVKFDSKYIIRPED
jgi:hypothetical protein